MVELNDNELKDIVGGFEVGIGTITLIAIGVPFFVGLIDGFVRPPACN